MGLTRSPLTVILAVKDADRRQLNGCICALASLKTAGQIDLLIVYSGSLPAVHETYESDFHSIATVHTEPRGVYAAFNRGLDERIGEYVLFMGVDDLALPGLDRVMEFILRSGQRPDLIAGYALMQDRGLSGPSRIRGSLIFRNWCQQALVYHSSVFETRRFDPKYRVQADHQVNLELLADRRVKVVYRKDVIVHFSSGGLTSQVTDWAFREDMPAIVRKSYGSFYWLLALGRRAMGDLVKRRFRQTIDV